jgi:hypothetical protein
MLKWLLAAVVLYGGFLTMLSVAQRSVQYFPERRRVVDENNEHMPVFLHHAICEGSARGQRSVSPETEMVPHEACGLDSAELEFPLELVFPVSRRCLASSKAPMRRPRPAASSASGCPAWHDSAPGAPLSEPHLCPHA